MFCSRVLAVPLMLLLAKLQIPVGLILLCQTKVRTYKNRVFARMQERWSLDIWIQPCLLAGTLRLLSARLQHLLHIICFQVCTDGRWTLQRRFFFCQWKPSACLNTLLMITVIYCPPVNTPAVTLSDQMKSFSSKWNLTWNKFIWSNRNISGLNSQVSGSNAHRVVKCFGSNLFWLGCSDRRRGDEARSENLLLFIVYL